MFGYRIPDADQAMLIMGGKTREDGAPVKVIVGRGAFVFPLFRRAQFLDLSMKEAEIAESCQTVQGLILGVRAVCAFRPAPDEESIAKAAQGFFSDQSKMSELVGRIAAGHLRSIVGSMTIEDIIQKRQTLAQEVLDASKTELANMGLQVNSFQIESIDDGDQANGYIAKMAAPHQAKIAQSAAIAQANADQAAAEAKQNSLRQQSDYEKQTAIVRANNQAEVDRQAAVAAQSGPLATAKAQQEVLAEETLAATKNAELVEAQQLATVVRPAEAQKLATIAAAEAEAEKTKLAASAAASENRVSLEQMLIEQLPAIVDAAAQGLARANLTILNGSEGLGEVVTGLVSQGLQILEVAKSSISAQTHTNGHSEEGAASFKEGIRS